MGCRHRQALLAIAELTGEQRFAEAAYGAFAYERSLFSAEHGSWPDCVPCKRRLRQGVVSGAPGIALSRLFALRYPATEALLEIRTALSTTAQAVTGNHAVSWRSGQRDILLSASEVLGPPMAGGRGSHCRAALARPGSDGSAATSGVESPGLMTGISGSAMRCCALPTLPHPIDSGARVRAVL
jgi:lantibiotic modifying enzyme